ncbi:MAG: A/G-specific adenine glycosylase [Planctomycetes bacterium]|nr:A/G-specific adenine glycosylase [Planctomycetota bacterium]
MTRRTPKPLKDAPAGGRGPRDAASAPAALALAARLLPWYRAARRRLPWREDPTPYRVWVSEVMLQQTRVETVVPYYLRFLERFPDVRALARAPLEEVLALWSGLGYYRRARALHAGARAVLARHGGEFPRELEGALELPGVGVYTAGAVLSIAYNLPVPVVDGNVERVLARVFRLRGDPKAAANARRLREISLAHMPEGHASEHNQALMELGATVCTPARPDCGRCPLSGLCLAFREGDPLRYPEPQPARATVQVTLHAALIVERGRYLLERVDRPGFLQGLWLFPFAEVDAPRRRGRPGLAAGPAPALVERLAATLGVGLAPLGHAARVRHAITYRRIAVDAFRLAPERPIGPRLPHGGLRWARLEELGASVPVSSIVTKLARRLEHRGAGPG